MEWRKLGVVWRPDGALAWQQSHAGLPTPYDLGDGRIRVFLYCQDRDLIGRVGYVDVDAGNPLKVIAVSDTPVVDIGVPGAFDDHGAVPVSVLKAPDNRVFLYYVGFELCCAVRYRLFTGLAISEDNGQSFRKYEEAPVLDRSTSELYFRCGGHALYEGGRFRLWYIGGRSWFNLGPKMVPVYDMKYLESKDGLTWGSTGKTIMPLNPAREHGFGRPYVIASPEGGYEMFYSVRCLEHQGYQLGYATSDDGLSWRRRDAEIGIAPADKGWDSEALCFPAVLSVGQQQYMFYNGNNFGETGVGVAIRVQ
jgi:hypothetical protein